MAYDAIVVGGSFAGLSAAMQLARARQRVLVVDSGLPRNRFSPAAHGFFGQDGRPPRSMIEDAAAQVLAYPTIERARDEVLAAGQDDGGFALTLAGGGQERAARLVLATGVRDELPLIPGVTERWGRTVLHCPFCHGYEVADRPIAVLANHPLSTHQAEMLPDWGPTTYFTQGTFEPDVEQSARLLARGVQIERTPIVELLGDAPALAAVRLADGRVVPLAAIFTAPAQHMASPLAGQLGCAVVDGPLGPLIEVDGRNQTTVPGVFAAGDAVNPMQSATLASASGVMAGAAAYQSLVAEAAAAGLVGAGRS